MRGAQLRGAHSATAPDMDPFTSQLEPLIPLGVSAVLAAVIGYEREAADRPAGLRTHMLVALASTLLVVMGDVMLERAEQHAAVVRMDPIRIIEAIVTGVAFIGAGTILVRSRDERVTGLTTAASLLAVAGIGIACGLELYLLAAVTSGLLLAVLRLLRTFERKPEA